jgi:hypothetical protein
MSEEDVKQQLGHEHERRRAAGGGAAPLGPPRAHGAAARLPPGALSPGGLPHSQQGPLLPGDAASAAADEGVPGDFGGLCEAGVRFVTRDFFSDSNREGSRRPEGTYLVSLHSFHAAPGLPRASPSPSPGPSSGRSGRRRRSSEKRSRDAVGGGSGGGGGGGGAGDSKAHGGGGGAGGEWGLALPSSLRLPAADDICLPGQAWGEGGRWIEQWDNGSARDTVREIMEYYHT